MEEKVESPISVTRKTFLKSMPCKTTQLFWKISLSPKIFVFAIYASTADSFTCVCTNQKHNAVLFDLK